MAEVSGLKARLQILRADVLPGSQLGKTCAHALRLWPRLEVFLTHGQVELDTNLAENAMRPVALGREKWLHIGDAEAGQRRAIIESCRRGLAHHAYLREVLTRLPIMTSRQTSEVVLAA